MAQKWLSIKNFEKYQSFTKKNPPWFKIHRCMFGDPEFIKLSPPYRFLYIGLIYLAVETNNKIYNDSTFLIQRLYISHTDLIHLSYKQSTQLDLRPLYRSGFLLTTNLSRVLSETETETETETEKTPQPPKGELVVLDDFEIFWKSYPRKIGKGAARKAWEKAKDRPPLADVLHVLDLCKQSAQWQKDQGQFIPHAATWLNQGRWADEVQVQTGPYDPNGFLSGLQSLIERHQA